MVGSHVNETLYMGDAEEAEIKYMRSRVEVLKLIRLSDGCYDRIPEFERRNLSTV